MGAGRFIARHQGGSSFMQKTEAISILTAAYDLSQSTALALQNIARAAVRAIPGPVVVAALDRNAQLDAGSICFEPADQDQVSSFHDLRSLILDAVHDRIGALAPGVVVDLDQVLCRSPRCHGLAHELPRLCIAANTGDGGGIYIFAGRSDARHAAALQHLHDLATQLAAAWRIRTALAVHDVSAPTARDVLRSIARHHDRDRDRDVHRSSGSGTLWQAVLDGSWSLLDAFTTAGTRYAVACENPGDATLRALSSPERAILDLALAGRSGKWIACELETSESSVTRALRSALAKVGMAEASDLRGIRSAGFEPLRVVSAGVGLAIARLPAVGLLPESLSGAERAVLTGLIDGKRVVAIARERGTSLRTVSHQITSIYKKLGASSRREVLALLDLGHRGPVSRDDRSASTAGRAAR
jgi:DNA-binding NarL/FixJ family response regulator